MSEPDTKLAFNFELTSSLKIDEAILKSRKVMEESKALTLKNNQKKSELEGKYKNIVKTETIKEEKNESLRALDLPCTPKTLGQTLKIEELQSEIRNLNNIISSQATNLKLLDSALSDCKTENLRLLEEINLLNQKHRQEISFLTIKYEQKIKNLEPKVIPKELAGIETRIRELEERFKGNEYKEDFSEKNRESNKFLKNSPKNDEETAEKRNKDDKTFEKNVGNLNLYLKPSSSTVNKIKKKNKKLNLSNEENTQKKKKKLKKNYEDTPRIKKNLETTRPKKNKIKYRANTAV